MNILILAMTLSIVSPRASCISGTEFVAAHAEGYPDDWSIVVVCDRARYARYEAIWSVRANRGAFTVLNARRTFILYDETTPAVARMSKTLELLAHELRHIKCMCDLGEGSGVAH